TAVSATRVKGRTSLPSASTVFPSRQTKGWMTASGSTTTCGPIRVVFGSTTVAPSSSARSIAMRRNISSAAARSRRGPPRHTHPPRPPRLDPSLPLEQIRGGRQVGVRLTARRAGEAAEGLLESAHREAVDAGAGALVPVGGAIRKGRQVEPAFPLPSDEAANRL